ncbi:MAG TPA: HAMP domain-containing sensor histidine kinase [Bacteroidota bacterium]
MPFTKLLGFKLFLIIAGVMAVGTWIFSAVTVNWHTEQYMRNAVQNVGRVSDVIQRSMHYSMLLNRREDIDHIIRTVGNEPGIEAIRIYNKEGEITFSSDTGEVGATVNFSNNACSACHAADAALLTPSSSDLIRIFQSENNERVIGKITPIKNESSCATAACHAHPESQTVLGVLDVMVPLKDFDASLAELKSAQYTNAVILAAAVTLFTGIFIWLMVNIPVKKLIQGTEQVRAGNLQHRIDLQSNDEIGTLADSFNSMTNDLRSAQEELQQWTRTLEERVREKTEELRRAQTNMIQVEKMVSLGTLAATVAHELNNPLEGVLTYAKLLKRRLQSEAFTDTLKHDIDSDLTTMADETARCGNIVKNLLLFSRQKVGEFRESDVVAILNQSFKLIDHHLQMHNIKLETSLPSTPPMVQCDANQLEQAFLAIEINAVEAMPGGGTLRVEVLEEQATDSPAPMGLAPRPIGTSGLRLRFSDTGTGIRDEDLPYIFEPFYTTKHDGKGTGLGLAVVYGIIERHGGSIQVQSRVHQGTTFTITLPRQHVPSEAPATGVPTRLAVEHV